MSIVSGAAWILLAVLALYFSMRERRHETDEIVPDPELDADIEQPIDV